jgi:hypothetical protein
VEALGYRVQGQTTLCVDQRASLFAAWSEVRILNDLSPQATFIASYRENYPQPDFLGLLATNTGGGSGGMCLDVHNVVGGNRV